MRRNLKVGGGTDPAPRAGKKFFLVVPLHFLALKAHLVVSVSAFVMVSTVWSVSCLLFFYSRWPLCPAICKSRGHVPLRAPWRQRHWYPPCLLIKDWLTAWYTAVLHIQRIPSCDWLKQLKRFAAFLVFRFGENKIVLHCFISGLFQLCEQFKSVILDRRRRRSRSFRTSE